MPANLTPDYLEAEEKLRQARTSDERVAALEEMLRVIPKHKGTDRIQADLKRKLAEERREAQRKPVANKKGGPSLYVKPEGAAQVFLIGPPNAGKSRLLATLTGAKAEVAAYPFTTQMYLPGMMLHENIWIQLVDMPALSRQSPVTWIPSVVRYGDLALVVLSLASDDILQEVDDLHTVLGDGKVRLGSSEEMTFIEGDGWATMRTICVFTNSDAEGAQDRLDLALEVIGDKWKMLQVECERPESLELLRSFVYDHLDIIRAYGKESGKPVDTKDPFVLPTGATVEELAVRIHRDLAQRLQYARIWSKDGSKDGLRVPRDYALTEGDVVQLYF